MGAKEPPSSSPVACVVGANGFIGRSAVTALVRQGFRVRAAARSSAQLPEELQHPQVDAVHADVADAASLEKAVAGAEVVVNCAGIYHWWVKDASEYTRVNDEGAENVAEACLGCSEVRRLIHISTAMAYGFPSCQHPFDESATVGPHASEYARTKHLGDQRVKQYMGKGEQLSITILYLGCVIGPGDTLSTGRPASVIHDFILGRIPMLVAPDTKYIYVHVRDVQQAIVSASTLPASSVAGQDFLIGNHTDVLTTRGFFDLIGKHAEKAPPSMVLNTTLGYWLAVFLTFIATYVTRCAPALPVDILRTARTGSLIYKCSKSEDVLGLAYTPISIAVAESVADVRRRLR